jgi:hypothetical protein
LNERSVDAGHPFAEQRLFEGVILFDDPRRELDPTDGRSSVEPRAFVELPFEDFEPLRERAAVVRVHGFDLWDCDLGQRAARHEEGRRRTERRQKGRTQPRMEGCDAGSALGQAMRRALPALNCAKE